MKMDMKKIKGIHFAVPEGVFYFDDPRSDRYSGPRHNQRNMQKMTRGTDAEEFYDEYLELVQKIKNFREKYFEIYERELEKEATDRVNRIINFG